MVLLVGVSIPSTGRVMEQPSTVSSDGNTLYVGGSGPGNYTMIHDAIDNASDGDTVFVYNGTYIENVVVDKSINLIGEDRDITIINRNKFNDVVNIIADGVTISCFTIQNSGVDFPSINISSNSAVINKNIITSLEGHGIKISGANNILISNNTFIKNYHQGIDIENSNDVRVLHNDIYSTVGSGIITYKVNNLVILENNFFTSSFLLGWDISISSTECLIMRNTFNYINGGIYLLDCKNCVITENNFMVEKYWINLVYIFPNNLIKNKNKFNNNYWFRPRALPKLIIGKFVPSLLLWLFLDLYIPIFQFDWNPAKEPYDISNNI